MNQTEPLLLYNTLKREKEIFIPQDPERVTMYACGPTVYNYAHIGNARPAVVFDLLYRLLSVRYPKVVYARNITDVDDKINAAAAEQNVSIDVITARFIDAYHEDMAALGVGLPTIEPRATEHIPVMIEMVAELVRSGHAYVSDGHVLFAIGSYPEYGRLSGRDSKDMLAGARIEVSDIKRHPGDFVLWKPSEPPQPGWDSPWGWGRPGWHLECSAMSARHLGDTIDIHGGGQDLVFPHHENEIAQSVCAHHGKEFARYWLHNGFVTVDKSKMSKSLGNTLVVHDLLERHRGETLRYLLLSAHYRQPLDWSDAAVQRCRRTLDRVYGVLRDANAKYGQLQAGAAPSAPLMAALADDINTPEALAELNKLARQLANAGDAAGAREAGGLLLAGGALMGLFQQDPEVWLTGDTAGLDDANIERLIEERNQARKARDFGRADEIRDELQAMGITLEDGPDGTRWRHADSS